MERARYAPSHDIEQQGHEGGAHAAEPEGAVIHQDRARDRISLRAEAAGGGGAAGADADASGAFLGSVNAGLHPGDAFARATSGGASELPFRGEMEASFGRSFAGVRAFLGGGGATEGLAALGARAAAHGSSIAFRDGAPSRELVAHELAHVVQQDGGAGGVQCKPTDVSSPGDAAEREADAAADAVLRGERVTTVGGRVAPGTIHRAVDTNGGQWDTTTYRGINIGSGVGKTVGADIALKFTPNDLVAASSIGLTQTVRTLRSTTPSGPVTSRSTVSARNAALEGTGDRAIDQGDPGPGADTIPNTNPLYPVENSPGAVSRTLTDVPASPGFGGHGSHRRLPAGGFAAPVDATLRDTPQRSLAFVGQEWTAKFETTAVVIDSGPTVGGAPGTPVGTYLGSIEWGWQVNPAGVASPDPTPIRIVQAGAPSRDLMAAAARWNAATFTDPTGGAVHDTVDLPTTSVGSLGTAAVNMTAPALIARLVTVDRELAGGLTGNDLNNKQFEKTALETELRRRNVLIDVRVVGRQDTGGAARPPEDEVFARLRTPSGRSHDTGRQVMRTGDSHSFTVSMASLVPVGSGAIQVQILDHDRAGTRSRAHDDAVVDMPWAAPFAPLTNTSSQHGGNYAVTVRFDR